MMATVPGNVEFGDLVSYGMFGLLDALAKFDPARDSAFEAYAFGRVRGAIIDEMRADDWAPRSVRAKARAINRAQDELTTALHRTPTRTELAAHLDLNAHRLSRDLADIAGLCVAPIDAHAGGARGWSIAETLADPGSDPAEAHDDAATSALLVHALQTMNDERVRLVLVLHYFENRTLAEIGERLGVTESRISQLHHKGLRTLRRQMDQATAA